LKLQNQISDWLKDYIKDSNLKAFVVGISGGIDSAVTSTLCAMTGFKTYAVIMPIHQNPDETDRGIEHCNWLKRKFNDIEIIKLDLTDSYETLIKNIPKNFKTDLSLANTRARIRMSTLYLIAGGSSGIVAGTGNKIEDFGVGFFTKYGDGGVDISPIADLMKSDVYKLAKDMGVADSILKAKPTDGLWDDKRTDEDQLGVSYDDLEWAMSYDKEETITKEQEEILKIYNKFRKANMHKMKPIPIFKVK
tara:strand:- start:1351 stop:2097 length:747 start_codon:yes stop_codon:yes gene_type:complete